MNTDAQILIFLDALKRRGFYARTVEEELLSSTQSEDVLKAIKNRTIQAGLSFGDVDDHEAGFVIFSNEGPIWLEENNGSELFNVAVDGAFAFAVGGIE